MPRSDEATAELEEFPQHQAAACIRCCKNNLHGIYCPEYQAGGKCRMVPEPQGNVAKWRLLQKEKQCDMVALRRLCGANGMMALRCRSPIA